MRVEFSRDEDLRVTMVHSTFATGCSVFEGRVLEVVLDLAATYAAEEVALGGQRLAYLELRPDVTADRRRPSTAVRGSGAGPSGRRTRP